MKRLILKSLVLLVVISAAYAGISASVEPAGKFIPTDKLRADDAVAFPVDI